jgi:hypothetical protein
MHQVLDRLADAAHTVSQLAVPVEQLRQAASQLTDTVQPLQSAAQRLNRLVPGRRGDSATS